MGERIAAARGDSGGVRTKRCGTLIGPPRLGRFCVASQEFFERSEHPAGQGFAGSLISILRNGNATSVSMSADANLFLAAVEVLSALSYCGSATVRLCQAWWTALGLAAMRLFPSGHFHDFLDRRDEKFIHLPAYLVVRYTDSGAIEIGAYGFENLARAVFLDFRSDEAACEIFRVRAGHTELFCGPKSKPFVAPRPRLEFQFLVMGEFRFESMLTLVESRHDPPHGTVASPHLGGNFDNSNILQDHSA
jgi:hypothetical protein